MFNTLSKQMDSFGKYHYYLLGSFQKTNLQDLLWAHFWQYKVWSEVSAFMDAFNFVVKNFVKFT